MTEETERWARLIVVYSGLDADLLRATLEEAGIPVLVRGSQVGLFGSAYQGSLLDGVEVLVPASALDQARSFLPDPPGDADDSGESGDDGDTDDVDEVDDF